MPITLGFSGKRHVNGLFQPRKRLFAAALLCISLLFVAFNLVHTPAAQAAQTIPYKVNFQGRLTDSNGNAKAAGSYNIKFRLMSASSGGTNLWQADRVRGASDYRVTVTTGGLFNVQLGDTTLGDPALSPSIFNTATNATVYLEVELPTPATATCSTNGCASFTEGAMTPRSLLASAAYAFNSDTVDGIDGASLARNDANNTFSGTNTFSAQSQFNSDASFGISSTLNYNQAWNGSNYIVQATGSASQLAQVADTGFHLRVASSQTAGGTATNQDILVGYAPNDSLAAAINAGVRSGNNQIDNGGFEFECGGWTGCTIDTSNPHTGNKAAKFVMSTSTSVQTIGTQKIAAQPGDIIYAQGWVKTTAGTTGTGFVSMCYYDKDYVWLSACDTSLTANPGTTYTLRTLTGSAAPANTAYVLVKFQNGGNGSTAGTWYYDDMFVTQVNRPGSLMMQDTTGTTILQIGGDPNGAIELGKSTGSSTTPFIDFHYGTGSSQDYNMRIINSVDGVLDIQAAGTATMLSLNIDAIRVGKGEVSPSATPTLFVVDHKTTFGDPTGVNGGMYYNASLKKFRCYEDDAWHNCADGVNAQTTWYYSNDFMMPSAPGSSGTVIDDMLVAGYAGTGTSQAKTASEAGHPGILRMNTASTGINGVVYTTGTATSIMFGGGTVWTTSSSLRLPTLSDGTNTYTVRSGYINTNNTGAPPTYGCYLLYSSGTNSGKWQGVCTEAGTSSTCDTGFTATANTWNNLQTTVNDDGTLVTFVVNGTNSCTVNSNIPTSTATGLGTNIHKTAGSTQRYVDLDYLQSAATNMSR